MVDEWESVNLGEVAAVRSGYAFKSSDWTNAGIPVVKIANVKGGRLEMSGCSFVTKSTASEAGEFQLTTGDILIAMTGYIGDVARVRKTDLPCVLNQRVGKFSVRDSKRLDANFLYTFLAWSETRQTIEGLGYGSAQPNVSPSLIHKIEMPLPPLPEQRAIAHILGTLDDKIELNRRMNETLEAMAQALFQDWFVAFGPTRAKMIGQEPYLPNHFWDIFPSTMGDDDLPIGWTNRALSELAELSTNSTSPGCQPDVVFEHYSIPAFDAGRMPAMDLGKSIKSNKYVVEPTSVLVSKLNPNTPRVWLPAPQTKYSVCSTEFMQFVPKHHSYRPFLYCLMSSAVMQERVLSHVTGSTGSRQRAQPSQIAIMEVMIPADPMVEAFNKVAGPLLDRLTSSQLQSTSLSEIRDTLLPKLISGELRIPDADRILANAL